MAPHPLVQSHKQLQCQQHLKILVVIIMIIIIAIHCPNTSRAAAKCITSGNLWSDYLGLHTKSACTLGMRGEELKVSCGEAIDLISGSISSVRTEIMASEPGTV